MRFILGYSKDFIQKYFPKRREMQMKKTQVNSSASCLQRSLSSSTTRWNLTAEWLKSSFKLWREQN